MVSLRAEQVDNNAVADTRSDHEEDVEETKKMVKHWIRFFVF